MNTKDLVASYEFDGFAIVKGFLSRAEVAEVLLEFEKFLIVEAPLLTGREINYVDPEKKIVNSVHKLAGTPGSFFHRLLNSERISELAGRFLRGPAKARGAEMFAKPAGKGLASPIHQDNFYWCLQPCAAQTALTIWVALDPVSSQNGGVTYLSGTQKIGILEHTDSNAPGSSQMVKDQAILHQYEHVTPNLEPGDAVVHDAMTLHYSAENKSGFSRRGMTMQMQRTDAKIDPLMLKHYEERLAKQLAKRTSPRD